MIVPGALIIHEPKDGPPKIEFAAADTEFAARYVSFAPDNGRIAIVERDVTQASTETIHE
jgi:hypothetical protein